MVKNDGHTQLSYDNEESPTRDMRSESDVTTSVAREMDASLAPSEDSITTSNLSPTQENQTPQETSQKILGHVVEKMGGTARSGQQEMVEHVARAFEDNEHLLVQAGTGTGKSLGYLVPAMDWAIREGKRVVVSTATLALQRQIVAQDAPKVAEAIEKETGKQPEVALLKGWNNYACLRKVMGGYPEEDALFSRVEAEFGTSSQLGADVVRAREWAQTTSTGDRDDLVPGVPDRAWRQVSVSKPECIGASCPLQEVCFPMLARKHAMVSDIVVTNHSMLGVQSTGTPVLPDVDAYVVDEAHDLVDRVTSQLTATLSASDMQGLVRLLRREKILVRELEKSIEGFTDILEAMDEGRLQGIPEVLQDALMLVLRELQLVSDDVKDMPNGNEAEAATKAVVKNRVDDVVGVVHSLLSEKVASGQLVVWVAHSSDAHPVLYVAPLDVSSDIADNVFEGKPAILTSATLSVGGSFQHVASQVGFMYPNQGPWRGVDVGSPFTYGKQGILYVANSLPAPNTMAYTDAMLGELRDLLIASRGGGLCLFTSRRAAEQAAEFIREETDLPVLLQGEDQLPTLVNKFADDPTASLFGTLSLWQGIDVAGDTCRLVVIDKIPFPRPNDALVEARSQAVRARGGNPFMEVSATQAALRLAQGAGRLIRRHTDRGVVAILDSRLRTKRYGSFLMASLPTMWPTCDGDVVKQALARISQHVGE